jgi:sporulation protein YtfJ
MSDMSEIIKTTLEGIDSFTDVNSVVGSVIKTPDGMTVIPISKITVGFLGGGADYGQKKLSQTQNFGGGSGAGISISPVAFLTVSPDSSVNLIPLNNDSKAGVDRVSSILERSPEIIERIKQLLT